MSTIRWRSALFGAVLSVLAYYLITAGIYLPLVASGSLSIDSGVLSVVLHAVVTGVQVLVGVLVATSARDRHGLPDRRAAVPTALAAGLLGALVVAGLTAALELSRGYPVPVGGLVLLTAIWLVVPAVSTTFVAPGPARPRATNRYLARLDHETGEVAAEYAGAIVVVTLVVSALLVALGPGGGVSGQLSAKLCEAITFGRGACGSSAAQAADPHAPTEPCVLVDTLDERSATLDVTFVEVAGGGTIGVQKMSDGTYRVSKYGGAGAGVTASVGAGLTVTVDDRSYGGELSAGASAVAYGEGGETWVVTGEKAKDDLVSYLSGQRDRETAAAAGPVGGIVAGGMALWDAIAGSDYTPPEADEVFVEASVRGSASATASGLVVGGSANADAAVALGARLSTKVPSVTTYYAMSVAGEAGAAYDDVVGRAGAEVAGEVSLVVAVTADLEGNPISITVTSEASGEYSAQAHDLFLGAEPTGPADSGGHRLAASLELTDDESLRIATDLLRASGIVPTDRNAAEQVGHLNDAVGTFMAAARDRGVLTRQELTTDGSTDFAVQAGLGAGVELGGSFSQGTRTVRSGAAQYLSRGVWKDWVACS